MIFGNNYGGSAIGNAIAGYMNGEDDYGTIGNIADDYITNDNGNKKNNGSWFNTLGRLGVGLLGGLSGAQANSQQSFLPTTQWLGNGLARINMNSNMANKQNQQGQAFGNTVMLGSLFGPSKSLLNKFGGNLGRIYNDAYGDGDYYNTTSLEDIQPIYTGNDVIWR